jgi:hypothetical protein
MARALIYAFALSLVVGSVSLLQVRAQDQLDAAPSAIERPIPFKQEPDPYADSAGRAVWGTLLSIGIAAGAAIMLKRYLQRKGLMHASTDSRINPKETRRVSNKLTVHLISIDGQDYVIAQTGDHASIMAHQPKTAA